MGTRLRSRTFTLLGTGAMCLLLLAAACPTDYQSTFVVEVHATGTGAGTVTVASSRISCDANAGSTQGDCTEHYINEVGHHLYTATPASGSIFVGWVSLGDGSNPCAEPTANICDALLTDGAPDTVILQPHFAVVGVEERHLRVGVHVSSEEGSPGAWVIASRDGQIRCSETPNAKDRCTAWYALGTTVMLDAFVDPTVQWAFVHLFHGWTGCTPDPAHSQSLCSALMTEDRLVLEHFTGANTIEVFAAGNGDGTVTSTPAGISCTVSAGVASGICLGAFGSLVGNDLVSNESVMLTATPAAGSILTGWSDSNTGDEYPGCPATGSCLVGPHPRNNSPEGVTATFNLVVTSVPLTVTLAGPSDGGVTSSPTGIDCSNRVTSPGTACTASYPANTAVTLTATPGANATFAGWSGGGCSGTGTCTVTLTAATSVTATFGALPPSTFPLTVAGAGPGTGTISSTPTGITCTSTAGSMSGTCSTNLSSGQMITLFATASAGSAFTGWSGGGCTGAGSCDVFMSAAATVTATFVVSQALTVTLAGTGTGLVTSSPSGMFCGTSIGQNVCAPSFPTNTVVTLTATPSNVSYFAGWSGGGCSGTGTCVVTLTTATTVTATFAPNTLGVVLAGTGTGQVTSSPVGVHCSTTIGQNTCASSFSNNTVVTLTATPSNVSYFAGWSGGGCNGTGPCVVTMTAATSVTATFAPNTLGVAIAGTGPGQVTSTPVGIVCPSPVPGVGCSASFPNNTVVTLTATPQNSSTFAGWSGGGCGGTGTCVVTMVAETTITATFDAASTFPLTVTGAGAGSGAVTSSPAGIACNIVVGSGSAGCSASFANAGTVTLTATASTGSTFAGWTGAGCTGTAACVVTMTTAWTVAATFDLTASFDLSVSFAGTGTGTVTSSPAGINCANFSGGGSIACTAPYASGTAVTLTSTPNGTSIFTGWSGGGCSGTAPCVVTMNAAATVTASFGLPSFALTVSGAGTGGGTVTEAASGIVCTIVAGVTSGTCTALVQSGLVAIPVPAAAQGSVFTGWSGDCIGTATCFLPMDQAHSVTATFTAVPTFTLTIRQGQTFMGSGSVASTPGGIACTFTSGQTSPTGTCAFAFPAGTAVTLVAGAAPPSTFATWLGAPGCGFANPVCIVTMDQDRAVDVVINP